MNATVKGRYRFEIYRPDGSTHLPLGDTWVDNLVTNAGLDSLFSVAQASGESSVVTGSGYGFLVPMTYCRLSLSGTQSVDPAVPGLSEQSADSARYIKSFPTITHNPPTTVYPDAVNQVTYSSDSNWVWAVFQRTFVFVPPASDRNWNAAAVSHSNLPEVSVFSRIITPATVTQQVGEELRVIYQLTVKIPKTALAVDLTTAGGFNPDGSIKVVGDYSVIFGGILANGNQIGATSADSIPSIIRGSGAATGGHLLTNSAFPADGSGITPAYSGVSPADSLTTAITQSAYTSGTFSRSTTLTWGFLRPVASESDVRSLFLGSSAAPSAGIQWLLTSNQTKDPDKSLSATFTIAWARPA